MEQGCLLYIYLQTGFTMCGFVYTILNCLQCHLLFRSLWFAMHCSLCSVQICSHEQKSAVCASSMRPIYRTDLLRFVSFTYFLVFLFVVLFTPLPCLLFYLVHFVAFFILWPSSLCCCPVHFFAMFTLLFCSLCYWPVFVIFCSVFLSGIQIIWRQFGLGSVMQRVGELFLYGSGFKYTGYVFESCFSYY